jgi:hypothetical protein
MSVFSAVRTKLTFSNVMAGLALFLVLGTGTAYAGAPNSVNGGDVVDGSLTGADIATNSVGSNDIKDNGVHSNDIRDGDVTTNDILNSTVQGLDILDSTIASVDILDGTVGSADITNGSVTSTDILDATITAADLGADSVGSAEIASDAVNATEIANDSIDSGEIVDFGLSNADVGVLFAQVNADGTIANSSGGVTGTHVGVGTYAVDFARDISFCAYLVTQGEAGVGGAGGAITGATDRSGNVEAVFATTRTDAGALADRAFQLVVVC